MMAPRVVARRVDWAAWMSVMFTAISTLVAITVQWGVVTTKLESLEKRLDEMIFEARSMRAEYQDIQRRLALLEGQHRQAEQP